MAAVEDKPSKYNDFYLPLREVNEIRLLRLQPRSNNGGIICTLEHAKLSDKQEYEALSYEWDSENNMRLVKINTIPFHVRENLSHALYQLVPTEGTRVLWIDAICINQNDDIERGHQVEQMGNIYSQATTVLIWLGLSDAASTIALIKIHCGDDVCTWLKLTWFCDTLQDTIDLTPDREFCYSDPPRRTLTAFNTMKGAAPWQLISLRNDKVHHCPISNSSTKISISRYPLLQLFENFCEAGCHDRRDKLFGLLSLATPCCAEAILVNYSLPWSIIYDKALERQILHHKITGRVPTASRLVSTAQRVQQNFGLTSEYCKNTKLSFEHIRALGGGVSNDPRSRINLTGFLRGRIIYTSSPVPVSAPQESQMPFLTLMAETEINDITTFLIEATKKENSNINSEYDIVQSFPDNSSDTTSNKHTESDPLKGRRDFRLTKRFGKFSENEKRLHPPSKMELEKFREILRNARASLQDKFGSQIMVAIEENGLIFFAPLGVREGDIVCQFESSNILCIVRENDKPALGSFDPMNLVGRAVSYLPSPRSEMLGICGQREETYAGSGRKRVLYPDLSTFYLLTCASSTRYLTT